MFFGIFRIYRSPRFLEEETNTNFRINRRVFVFSDANAGFAYFLCANRLRLLAWQCSAESGYFGYFELEN